MLVFSRTTSYRHADAIDAGRETLEERFGAHVTDDPAAFEDLGDVDVVVLLQTNGPGVLQGDAARGLRALGAGGRWRRGDPRRRQRGPRLGVLRRAARRRAFPRPPAGPAPARDGAGRAPPGHGRTPAPLDPQRRVVPLRPGAGPGRERPGDRRRRPDDLDHRGSTAAARSTPRSATPDEAWSEPRYREHVFAAIEWAHSTSDATASSSITTGATRFRASFARMWAAMASRK